MTDTTQTPGNTEDADLGPKPDAHTEPREPNPGGVDAMDAEEVGEALVPDPTPEENPAVAHLAPEVLKEGEDTSTEATRSGGDVKPTEESPA